MDLHLIIHLTIALIALLHFVFLWLEMFAWETKGPAVFTSFPKELFHPTRKMAANQGLYNGFLGAGLVWSLFIEDGRWSFYVALFFLCCVLIAGIYGGLSISKKIFYIQGLPALVAIILLHLH